jgi:hypothetical protein
MTEEAWRRRRNRLGVGLGFSLAGFALGAAATAVSLSMSCSGNHCDPMPPMIGVGLIGAPLIIVGSIGTYATAKRLYRHVDQRPPRNALSTRPIVCTLTGTQLHLRF